MSAATPYAKILNLVYKLTTRRQDDMPLFHGNDIPEFKKAIDDLSLAREKPGKHQLSEEALNSFIDKLQEDYNIGLAQIGVMVDGVVVKEHYVKPYTKDYRHVTYSMCKSVLSMAVGIAVDKGIIRLDEKITDIFTERDSIFFKRNIKNVTVEHLLTMTSCVSFDEVSSYFHMDWQKAFMGSDLEGIPGENFCYNSLNSYMLASIIVKRTNRSLMDFLQENLFSYLGITDITWDKCSKGIEKGGWGMKLSLIDMLKLGQLVLNKGLVDVGDTYKQIISKKWIENATSTKVKIDYNNVIDGYGYHIWTLKDGSYLFNGLFGQNVYINPNRNMVIAVFASSYAIFPDEKLVGAIIDYAANDKNFVKDKKNLLLNTKNILKKKCTSGRKSNTEMMDICDYVFPWVGKQFIFSDYAGSILPLASQVVYSNYTSGISCLEVNIENNTLILDVTEKFIDRLDRKEESRMDSYKLSIDLSDIDFYNYQVVEIGGKKMPIASIARLLFDEYNRKYLALNICFLEEVSDRIIMLYFEDNKLTIRMIETPNINIIIKRLSEENLVFRSKNMTKHDVPDYIKYKFDSIVCPHAVSEECI